MERSKPSDGTKKRLIRIMGERYALTIKNMMKLLRLSEGQTKWYIAELKRDNTIYIKYRTGHVAHYALRREE